MVRTKSFTAHAIKQRLKRRERRAVGLCFQCPGRLNLYASRCDECGERNRLKQRKRKGCKAWVLGGPGRPIGRRNEQ